MIPVSYYSHNNGLEIVKKRFPREFSEVIECIHSIDAEKHKSKVSKEKTMTGRMLYSPVALNKAFDKEFLDRKWEKIRIPVETTIDVNQELEESVRRFYGQIYHSEFRHKGYREMDFIKNKLGVEVQFGKYAFMVYNVAAKMTIFHKLGIIDAGIEIVPMRAFASSMSTGVSSLEQFKTDLEMRGISNIDIPVLIIGIDRDI